MLGSVGSRISPSPEPAEACRPYAPAEQDALRAEGRAVLTAIQGSIDYVMRSGPRELVEF